MAQDPRDPDEDGFGPSVPDPDGDDDADDQESNVAENLGDVCPGCRDGSPR